MPINLHGRRQANLTYSKTQCHPERVRTEAKRKIARVEGPCVSGGWPALLPFVLPQLRMPQPLWFSKAGDFDCLRYKCLLLHAS